MQKDVRASVKETLEVLFPTAKVQYNGSKVKVTVPQLGTAEVVALGLFEDKGIEIKRSGTSLIILIGK